MTNEQEKQILWNEGLKEIGNRLRRELRTEERLPDRMRDLIAQLEAHAPKKKE